MHEVTKLNSFSLFVGTGKCNANCSHCAGRPLRKYAPKEDGIMDKDLFYRTIKDCYSKGARYLSISSSGEPTLSPIAVTNTLRLIYSCRKEGIELSPINLYSNGIRIGEDKAFSDRYLPYWHSLGLTTVYVTVHDVDEKENARLYGIDSYPSLTEVVSRIHRAGLQMRANLVLSKNTISTLSKLALTAEHLKKIGVDSIAAWPIRNMDDKPDLKLSPLEKELDRMEIWAQNNNIRVLREKSREAYSTGQKLTLFPDGTLSNTWCRS